MAAAKAMHRSSSVGGSRSGILIDTLQLVAPRKEIPVPNHLLDTKIYSKVAQNTVVQARPAVIHFGGFELGKTMKQKLFIANVSSEVQRYHIIPPQTKFFNIKYTKNDRLVPGLTLDCVIEFVPDEWRYYYDCIRINCKGDDNLIVPIHAYPIMSTADFPSHLDFPPVPVGEKRTKILPLQSNCPVDFEFTVNVPQHHAAFKISPVSGTIPALGEACISVTFSPSDFSTCQCTIQVNVSQFNAKPLLCVISGTSSPGLQKEQSESSQKESEDASVLDPACLSAVDRSRRKKKTRRHRTPSGQNEKPVLEIEKNGLKFPVNMNTPFAVACVLNQEPGKLRAKDIREAVVNKEEGAANTRQMKEALFEHNVRQVVYEERQNQLRWQVRLGEEQICAAEKVKVLEHREQASSDYKLQRGDPVADQECSRPCTDCVNRRTFRDCSQLSSAGAQFDLYLNDPWATRHALLTRFMQAARTVIIRKRADDKLRLLTDMVTDMGKRKHSLFQAKANLIQEKDGYVPEDELEMNLAADKVSSVTFPTYKAPEVKDDMAPDALDQLAVEPTVVVVKHKVPYYDLKVAQQYRLCNYSKHSAHEAGRGYVQPGVARQLRGGAEDELINLAVPDVTSPPEAELETPASGDPSVPVAGPALGLQPPESLFSPPEYPPMHIFNPTPGLQVYQAPLPYSETDPDYHLCPLPRYSQGAKETILTATQKKYLDREDVIKGVMLWKKFPSQGLTSLANTPTLTNVWVPRWTDPFVSELLPHQPPGLLDQLPPEDRPDEELEDDGAELILTPEMVSAQFSLIDRVTPVEEKTKEDVFPHGNKMPSTNIPVSSQGPVPRERREQELDQFLCKKYNRLGQKIHQRVHHLNSLKTDPDLVLQ